MRFYQSNLQKHPVKLLFHEIQLQATLPSDSTNLPYQSNLPAFQALFLASHLHATLPSYPTKLPFHVTLPSYPAKLPYQAIQLTYPTKLPDQATSTIPR